MATQQIWGFLMNPILSVTDGSYRLAVRISNYHLGALKSKTGDPSFDALISTYEPLHTALLNSYEIWKASGGGQEGNTLNVNQLLNLLSSTKIKQWDIAIQIVYDNKSPQYMTLLPDKRVPFQNGSQTDRLAALKALSVAIGSDAALNTVQNEVDTYYKKLSDALELQKGSMAAKGTASDDVETARIAMATGQYANLGSLINKYAATPDYINQFFDLVAIRSGSQVIFTGDTKPLEHENILKHTFISSDDLKLENEGNTVLVFYLAALKTDAPGAKIVTVQPATVTTVKASDLGDVTTNSFLNIFNPDTNNIGDWTVEFV